MIILCIFTTSPKKIKGGGYMWVEWLKKASEVLPGCDDVLFTNVWSKKRLLFDNKTDVWDSVDYYSARMIAAALKRKRQLLITLPDFKQHRPAFLLATALVRYFLDLYKEKKTTLQQANPVLYFGANIGIREQLCRTSIKGLEIDFAEIFHQQDIRRGATIPDNQEPQRIMDRINWLNVTTVYSPADPKEILQSTNPPWIAVDCSDAKCLSWFNPLLQEAVNIGIPVIAWCQNPLSKCVNDYESIGNAFIWPTYIQPQKDDELSNLLSIYDQIQMEPSIINGNSVDQFSNLLLEIRYLLVQMTKDKNISGRLEKDAIAIHWKYLNALESMAVPFDFYEVEASKFWGLQPINRLSEVCDHFRKAIIQANISTIERLECIGVLLDKARLLVECNGCALWEACINYCLEDNTTDKGIRLLVFTSDSKKKLFLFALLAKYNTTEDDLHKLAVYVTSFNELKHIKTPCDKDDSDIHWSAIEPLSNGVFHPTIVGLPSIEATPQLFYVFKYLQVNIILYPHQYPIFLYRQAGWSRQLGGNIHRNVNTLSYLSQFNDIPDNMPIFTRIQVLEPMGINIQTTKRISKPSLDTLWQPKDTATEVEWLLSNETDTEEDEMVLIDQPPTVDGVSTAGQSEAIWCSEAIKVNFDQEWYAYFSPGVLVNVISDKGLDARYVKALHLNDRVLIIPGQQRQSLYDLIISRVHKHPSIELDIALLRRWQEDLRISFEKWIAQPTTHSEVLLYGQHDIDGLLRKMQASGSRRNSNQTISNWINGYVLCPIEQEDLMRIAEILNIGFVRQYYKNIYKAANRLRGLHRGLSKKLNRWLQDQATGKMHKREDDVIDAELGLTFGDIRNSLLVLQIKNIEYLPGPFLKSSLGRIEKEE